MLQLLLASAVPLVCLFALGGCRTAASMPSAVVGGAYVGGADVSALTRLERDGAIYRDEHGRPGDALKLLREAGVAWFRLRLFVDPDGEGLVVNDLAYTIALARRVKAEGGLILLDLHYSDTWADPGKQIMPARWRDLDSQALVAEVERYTRAVCERMIEEGVAPDMVQVGNEISSGMLWPHGQLYRPGDDQEAAFDRLAELLRAGIRGVREAGPWKVAPPVMIHVDRGDRWLTSKAYFDALVERDVAFEVIGFSYYPRFHGTLSEVRENLNRTAERYGKPVALVEVGFAYGDAQWEPSADRFEFPVTPAGQAAFAQAMVQAVREVPDGLGLGVFWWHAAAVPTRSGLAWEGGRLGLFDRDGRRLSAAHAIGGSPVSP